MKFVDLGLPSKTLWADRNIGANRIEDVGIYTSHTESFYHKDIGIPSEKQFEELIRQCVWKWTTKNHVKGYKIVGPNGNSIFLPLTGQYDGSLVINKSIGLYWSIGSKYIPYGDFNTNLLGFNSYSKSTYDSYYYHHGRPIRAVKKNKRK